MPALARPPEAHLAHLARGIAITNWFRFPASTDPAKLAAYIPDTAMDDLRARGFTFVRLPVQQAFLAPAGTLDPTRLASLTAGINRLRRANLAVVVALFGEGWRLETSATDRAAFIRLWAGLAPALRAFGVDAVFPEVLNEPVFAATSADWASLQEDALRAIRAGWPDATVILTGAGWGSVEGLLALAPSVDTNVVYSVHGYEPTILTTLAAFRPGLDRAALAKLPFPMTDLATCRAIAASSPDTATRGVAAFYCADGWTEARVAKRLGKVAAWAKANGNAAILLGEFGAAKTLNAPARLAWISAMRGAAMGYGFGWCVWGLDDVMGFGVARAVPPYPMLDAAVLSALGLGP
jgi:hypothetical protein